jgi:phenylacetate-CoA ligase
LSDGLEARIASEQREQARWRSRPARPDRAVFDRLVDHEFLCADEHQAWVSGALREQVRFAAAHVPYYRCLLGELGLEARGIERAGDLQRLPLLTKADLVARGEALLSDALPAGDSVAAVTTTSGTTGQPVRVEHSARSFAVRILLRQRGARWFHLDPAGAMAVIKPARDLPRMPDGGLCPVGTTCAVHAWPLVGRYFETGRYFGYPINAAVDDQLEWLERHRPQYLRSLSANLELLALASQGRAPPMGLRGVIATAQQLTPAMEQLIASTWGVPIHIDYGLNEIGTVAIRCPEGRRYHVQSEHCLVEIVDQDHRPCRPGEFGRILVTSLTNRRMPLLRYDTDDLGEVVEGPCPCGRTLPAFGEVRGRYRRLACLPPGTWDHWLAIQRALRAMPPELVRPLRQYQLHQRADKGCVLRLVAAGVLAPAFHERLASAWHDADATQALALEIVEVDQIPKSAGVKLQSFTSAFFPPVS